MNTYKAKSSANRAAKKFENPIVEQLASGEWAMFENKGEHATYHNVPAKKDTQKQQAKHFNSSTIDSPCKAVWDIAESMPNARRKDVIAACVEAGIAFYTARTQYQQWKTASKAQKK